MYGVVKEVVESPAAYLRDPAPFLLALHNFMETASLGGFESRLRHLSNVHRHLVALEQTGTLLPPRLHAHIWNTAGYYRQFSRPVADRLALLRAPIHKKMRDWVKISRFNDANYYALKDSVLKGQKMLARVVRDWKKVLRLPLTSLLAQDPATLDLLPTEKKGGKERVGKEEGYLVGPAAGAPTTLSPLLLSLLSRPRLRKLRRLFARAERIVGRVLEAEAGRHAAAVQTLSDLTAEIIEGAHALQNLPVSYPRPRHQVRSDAS